MPLYVYDCCNTTRNVLQKVGQSPPACPYCRKPMKKQITAPGGFILKGGGYYKGGFNK